MSSSPAAVAATSDIAAAATSAAPRSVLTLLISFQSLQSSRMTTYARFKSAFRRFLDEREEWENGVQEDAERKAKQSTLMLKGGMQTDSSSSSSASASASESAEQTLTSIRDAERRAQPNPEVTFQRVCTEVMAQFQQVSKEVREVIAALKSHAADATSPADAIASAAHFGALLQSLQLLEKSKLELTIHQQMLHNQSYVLAHPQQHGQLQEHCHHVHSVTDAQGRVREHPKHKHSAGCSHSHAGLDAVGEDEEEGDGDDKEGQELADNAQPFTRHLSALLSDTAFATQSPFLFPPSGAAPTPLVDPASTAAVVAPAAGANGAGAGPDTLHPHLSAEAQAAFESQVADLRAQEGEVVEKINEILEEVREHIMEEQQEADEE